jgi:Tol biopolymer transport system component
VYRTRSDRRLEWFDRRGTQIGTVWSPAPYLEVSLATDGARVAVVRTGGPATWVHDFARETSVKVAPALRVAVKPIWSPAGDAVAVLTNTDGRTEFVSVPIDGGSAEERLFSIPGVGYATSWSRDGVLYTEVNPRTKEDLWVMAKRNGTWSREPFLVTDNRESDASFSPDGRAVAYVSDESGTSNVYVRSFPSTGLRKFQVSTTGGYQPRWRRDGQELFYLSATGQLMSVKITSRLESAPGLPTLLFQTDVFGGGATLNNWYWDVTPDGQRFLINTVIPGNDPSALNVVLNWQAGLKR